MKNQRNTLALFCALAVPALFTGCASTGAEDSGIIDRHPLAAKAVIQIATVRYIDGDTTRAAKVAEYVDYVSYITSGQAYTLDAVVGAVKNEIDWTRLKPTETILVLNLIDGVSAYVAQQLDGDTTLIDASALLTVNQALAWIKEAASLTAYGQPVPGVSDESLAELGATEATMIATFLAKLVYFWAKDRRAEPDIAADPSLAEVERVSQIGPIRPIFSSR